MFPRTARTPRKPRTKPATKSASPHPRTLLTQTGRHRLKTIDLDGTGGKCCSSSWIPAFLCNRTAALLSESGTSTECCRQRSSNHQKRFLAEVVARSQVVNRLRLCRRMFRTRPWSDRRIPKRTRLCFAIFYDFDRDGISPVTLWIPRRRRMPCGWAASVW